MMLLLVGLFVVVKALAAEGCVSNQPSTVSLIATENEQALRENVSQRLPVNASCQWNITAPVGKVVRIKIRASLLSGSCNDEYIKILDGPSSSSNLIAKYCNDGVYAFDSYFFSTGRFVFLELKTGTGYYNRLRVTYHAVPFQDCSLNMTLEAPQSPSENNFSSPYYPLGFPMNMTCGWFIKAPENQTVKLQLTSRLSSSYKSSDRVEVYDVDGSELSVNNLRLSNPYPNTDTIYSKFRSLYILFKSDRHPQESLSESGIIVLYTAFETVRTCSSSNSKDQNVNIILKDRSGIIKTPGYPSNFPTNLITQCYWKILAPKNHVVRLDFISFRMGSSHCVYIHDNINKKNPVETFKCRSKTSFTFYASGREASLSVYHIPYSDGTSGPGFIANYSVTPIAAMGPCNITGVDNVIPLTGETGRLFSPLYPQTYPNDMMCTWKITVPEGNFVRLRITSFDLGFSCRGSTLKINDGQSSSGNLLKSFCGRTFERSVFSSGRYLWVRFQSPKSGYVYGTGFNAVFEAVTQLPAPFSCQSDRLTSFKSDTGTLASYNYPLPYDDKIECTWTIKVDLDYRIRLSFDFFNLSQSSDCSVDYVEVRDGVFKTSDLIGRYCGTEKPESITSDSWDMRVTFKSSGKVSYPGFKASYKRKKSTTAILKIVGIVLGALSAFCALVAGCCKYCGNSNNSRDAPVVQDSENINQMPGFNNYTSQEQVVTTKM